MVRSGLRGTGPFSGASTLRAALATLPGPNRYVRSVASRSSLRASPLGGPFEVQGKEPREEVFVGQVGRHEARGASGSDALRAGFRHVSRPRAIDRSGDRKDLFSRPPAKLKLLDRRVAISSLLAQGVGAIPPPSHLSHYAGRSMRRRTTTTNAALASDHRREKASGRTAHSRQQSLTTATH